MHVSNKGTGRTLNRHKYTDTPKAMVKHANNKAQRRWKP